MNQYDKFTGIGSQELKAKILNVFIFTNHNNTLDKKSQSHTKKKTQKLFPQKKTQKFKGKVCGTVARWQPVALGVSAAAVGVVHGG
jgi:hypothetical protein